MNKGQFYSDWHEAQKEIAEIQKRIENGEKIEFLQPLNETINSLTKNKLTR
jgi:hypothetical protein